MFWKRDTFYRVVFQVTALCSTVALLLIFLFLFGNAIPALREVGLGDFLVGRSWRPVDTPPSYGIFPMIIGSLYVTAGAILLGVPVGVFTAVFLAYYCPKRLYPFMRQGVKLLAGIPSVVYGFFGMTVLVPAIRTAFGGTGSSILAASVMLGMMILPTIISISEDSLRAVPVEYYEGSAALGASSIRTIFFVMVPAAKSGILTAVVLGIGRAIGETMAVVMIAGNQARLPHSILQGVRTLTANIVLEMGYAADLHRQVLIATGAVLFVFILLLNLSFAALKARGSHETK